MGKGEKIQKMTKVSGRGDREGLKIGRKMKWGESVDFLLKEKRYRRRRINGEKAGGQCHGKKGL